MFILSFLCQKRVANCSDCNVDIDALDRASVAIVLSICP